MNWTTEPGSERRMCFDPKRGLALLVSHSPVSGWILTAVQDHRHQGPTHVEDRLDRTLDALLKARPRRRTVSGLTEMSVELAAEVLWEQTDEMLSRWFAKN
jgi:hypothetical protein